VRECTFDENAVLIEARTFKQRVEDAGLAGGGVRLSHVLSRTLSHSPARPSGGCASCRGVRSISCVADAADSMLGAALRFAVVGVSNTLIGVLVIYLAWHVWGWPDGSPTPWGMPWAWGGASA
jgi:hypothetical protein